MKISLYKVGSTTLLRHFLTLSDTIDPRKRQDIVDSSSPYEFQFKLHRVVPKLFKLAKFTRFATRNHRMVMPADRDVRSMGSLGVALKREGYFAFSFVRHPFDRSEFYFQYLPQLCFY